MVKIQQVQTAVKRTGSAGAISDLLQERFQLYRAALDCRCRSYQPGISILDTQNLSSVPMQSKSHKEPQEGVHTGSVSAAEEYGNDSRRLRFGAHRRTGKVHLRFDWRTA